MATLTSSLTEVPQSAWQQASLYGFGRECHSCKEQIGDGSFKEAGKRFFHEECLRCYKCNVVLDEDDVKITRNRTFCADCKTHLFNPACTLCKQPIDRAQMINIPQPGNAGPLRLHRACFKCNGCHRSMGAGQKVMVEGRVFCSTQCGVQFTNQRLSLRDNVGPTQHDK